jgi:antitoxin (DNA-binding transcriptional repressor) of toxin-antitoxin stability system
MQLVNIHAAKTHLSALVSKAAAGESFVIAKAGHPLVTVSPYMKDDTVKRVGFLKGNISVPHNFDSIRSGELEEMFVENA